MHGTSAMPMDFAASSRVCPHTMTRFLSMMMGCLKPNFSMLALTYWTAPAFLRGFFSYGLTSETGIMTMLSAEALTIRVFSGFWAVFCTVFSFFLIF